MIKESITMHQKYLNRVKIVSLMVFLGGTVTVGANQSVQAGYCYQYPAQIAGPTSSTNNVCAYYLIDSYNKCSPGWTFTDYFYKASECIPPHTTHHW